MIDQSKYLNYLLQSYKIPELKSICKHYEIKGYSTFKKQELIAFIVDSLSIEEQQEFIKTNELEIIDKEFNMALKIIRRSTPEKLISLKVMNKELGELEVKFQGRDWGTSAFLSINEDNIDDPERDCDCIIGSNMGFCMHYWVCFLFCLKKQFFKLKDWKLTPFPTNLGTIIKLNEYLKA